LPQLLSVLAVSGGFVHLVERPRRVAGNGKVEVEGQVHDVLGGVARRGRGLDLAEAVAHEPDTVDEQPVGIALNLKVAEKRVCAEEREDLVEDVVALAVRVRRLEQGQRRVGQRQRVGGAAGLGSEREEGEVADEARDVGVLVEDGVVGLRKGASVKRSAAGRAVSCRHHV
jgi:hypothetical protein